MPPLVTGLRSMTTRSFTGMPPTNGKRSRLSQCVAARWPLRSPTAPKISAPGAHRRDPARFLRLGLKECDGLGVARRIEDAAAAWDEDDFELWRRGKIRVGHNGQTELARSSPDLALGDGQETSSSGALVKTS